MFTMDADTTFSLTASLCREETQANFDSVLHVYRHNGDGIPAVEVGYNDDTAECLRGSHHAEVTLQHLEPGRYFIVVGGSHDSGHAAVEGEFQLEIRTTSETGCAVCQPRTVDLIGTGGAPGAAVATEVVNSADAAATLCVDVGTAVKSIPEALRVGVGCVCVCPLFTLGLMLLCVCSCE